MKPKHLGPKIENLSFEGRDLPSEIGGNFYDSFMKKEFAKNFLITRDPGKAYEMTFPDKPVKFPKTVGMHLLEKALVQTEIKALLPSDEEVAGLIKAALSAPVEGEISWGEKHKYMETSLKLKGHLRNEPNQTQINVGMVIKES